MRAATIRDGSISVQEHPDPVPQAGELLVRVRAAGLNGADMMQLAGGYPAPPGAPADIPFDVILELVGAPNWPANLDCLAERGRIAVIGVGAGARVEVDLQRLMRRRAR